MSRIEDIKNMDTAALAEFIHKVEQGELEYSPECISCNNWGEECLHCIERWLESEGEEE